MRRLLAKSEKNLDGKSFNEFIALILISHLAHKMKEANLYKKYTMQQLLDTLDVIECKTTRLELESFLRSRWQFMRPSVLHHRPRHVSARIQDRKMPCQWHKGQYLDCGPAGGIKTLLRLRSGYNYH